MSKLELQPDRSRSWAAQGIRLGSVSDLVGWREIQRAYLLDNVEAAYEGALSVGAGTGGSALGFYQIVEGEALARRASKIVDVAPWLKLECQEPEEGGLESLGELLRVACESVAHRLGWTFEEATMITVLLPDADVPWHSARYGYYMDKTPYDKICLPAAALSDESHLRSVVAHEYAHVITTNLTRNRAPQWVEEGVSTVMEGRDVERARQLFLHEPGRWQTGHDLELAFGMERRNGENAQAVMDAYLQSLILCDFIQKNYGDKGLGGFLRVFAEHSLWEELQISAFGRLPADQALRQSLHLTQDELFSKANPGA